MESLKKYLAEFIGTLTLVLFACGTAAFVRCNKDEFNVSYLLTALAFGLVLVAMVYSIGNISGCHINPAVSIAMLINNKISVKDCIFYIIAQCLGGIVGAAGIGYFTYWRSGFGANTVYYGDIPITIVIEAVLTFIFVLAVLGATSKIENSSVAGLVIGLSLTLVHIFGIHFTGTSVNPARSIGPALFSGGVALQDLWVFIVAPIIGGIVAGFFWKFMNYKKAEKSK